MDMHFQHTTKTQPIHNQYTTNTQSRHNQDTPKTHPRHNQDTTKAQPRHSQDTTKTQLRQNQDITNTQPRRNQITTNTQPRPTFHKHSTHITHTHTRSRHIAHTVWAPRASIRIVISFLGLGCTPPASPSVTPHADNKAQPHYGTTLCSNGPMGPCYVAMVSALALSA